MERDTSQGKAKRKDDLPPLQLVACEVFHNSSNPNREFSLSMEKHELKQK